MIVKINNYVVNLKHVKSVVYDDSNFMTFSFLADYEFYIKMTPKESEELFAKFGINIIKINKTDFVVRDNVLMIEDDNDEKEILITYKDGSDETYDKVQPLPELTSISLKEIEDEDSNIDVPKEYKIPSDLKYEKKESSQSISVQVVLGLIALSVIVYQLYKSGFIK